MIVTISGTPGSGKSTVGKLLAQELGYKYFSVGELRGQMAIERGMTIDQLNQLGEKEDWTDKKADEMQAELGKTKDNFVFEGRLSWHFIPNSFKVFLIVDTRVAAERSLQNRAERKDEKQVMTVEEAEKSVLERLASDKKRYLQYYDLDYTDPKHYDLVVDTTHLTIKEVIDRIMRVLPISTLAPNS